MDDSTGSAGAPAPWLLLIHQLPPKPDYLRVKVRRRLQRIGAAALKNTVYLLPNTEEALEDLTWLARDIADDGGSAMICEATFVDGISDEEIEAMLEGARGGGGEAAAAAARRGADRVEPGRTWVTRAGVHVDRIASAWLIRRYIDPAATFRFVPARGHAPVPGELRFDMFRAEYGHGDGLCTFQTLVARFGLDDPALAAIGEIVHDIDCKDDRYGRPEAPGVAGLIRGIVESHPTDEARLERGAALLDDLHASLRRARR